MAESSYYPLHFSKDAVDVAASPPPTKGDPDPIHPADDITASPGSRSSGFLAPLHRQRSHKSQSPGRPPAWRTLGTPLGMGLLPIFAIAYLAFCYTVHGRVVPVSTYGLYAITPEHLATIKGGITSISIVIISIALYPIYDIISKLRSEEFFRVLASRSHGVPLETINYISTPSFSQLDTILAMWRHRCSNYYILGIVASLLVWITATLAPGALTVDSVLADGALMAFAIGAIRPQSVLNGTDLTEPAFYASANTDTAASIAWAETELGVQYSFAVENTSDADYAAFIAPSPLDLSTTTSARWLSDVIGINPTCSWASTNLTSPIQISSNLTSSFNRYFATAYLADFNLDVQVNSDDLTFGEKTVVTVKNPTNSAVTNHTTHAPTVDGSTVFLLGQCQSGCSSNFPVEVNLDLTGLNTTFTIALTDQTWSLAILACVPNLTIETREVRSNGHGLLSVQPRPVSRPLTRQGNLNHVQTTALFSIATMSLTQSAGKLSGHLQLYSSLGSQLQADLLFGKSQISALPNSDDGSDKSVTLTPAPIEDITQVYTHILQSVAKTYLAGYLGTAYVPGRISVSELVFAASIPNLAVSTAMFVLLVALIVVASFRPGKDIGFTLVNVAAAVHGSELPAQFVQIKSEQMTGAYGRTDEEAEGGAAVDGAEDAVAMGKVHHGDGDVSTDQQNVVEMFGERRIYMQRRVDGSPVLHMT